MSACDHRLEITPGFLLLVAGMFYLDRGIGILPWALLACAVHEAAHFAAAFVLKGRLVRLTLSAVGAEMRFEYRSALSYGQENLVALAGPIANLLLGFIACETGAFLPGILSLGIGGFNLLPVLPLDGGVVLQNLLLTTLEDFWAERILIVISGVLTGILLGIGAVVAAEYANVTLLLTSGWLLTGNLQKRRKK